MTTDTGPFAGLPGNHGIKDSFDKASSLGQAWRDYVRMLLLWRVINNPDYYKDQPEKFDKDVKEALKTAPEGTAPEAAAAMVIAREIRKTFDSLKEFAIHPLAAPEARGALITKLGAGLPSGDPLLALFDTIVKPESRGDYNIVFGGRHIALTSMSVKEVLKWQRETPVPVAGGTNAAGKYQIIPSTLEGLVKKLGLSGDEKFDEAMQDRLGLELAKGRGLDDFLTGKISTAQIMKNLSMEWAGLPKDMSGASYYGGVGANRMMAGISGAEEMSALERAKAAVASVGSSISSALSGVFHTAHTGEASSIPPQKTLAAADTLSGPKPGAPG